MTQLVSCVFEAQNPNTLCLDDRDLICQFFKREYVVKKLGLGKMSILLVNAVFCFRKQGLPFELMNANV